MPQKMLVGDKDTVLVIPAFEIDGVPNMAAPGQAPVPIDPSAAGYADLFNYYIPITTPADAGSSFGGNVTCAVVDDMNLANKDSGTKNTRTLCSVGQSEDLTVYNFDAVMNFLRDADPQDDTSEFNLAANLVQAPDLAYVIAHRIGYSHDELVTGTQEWHLFYAWTDHAIPAASDDEYLALGETFIAKGLIHFKAEVTA